MNIGILLHHIETFSGVVIVVTNIKDRIDNAFFRRFKFILEFTKPSVQERVKLWKLLIPSEAPLASNVDINLLAQRYDMCGGNIKTVVFRAASRAALRRNVSERVITMEDLVKSCEEEIGKDNNNRVALSMYT
jgi:SpoVK/Ycf46/Vps4 family AAA+-type ATPase